MSIFTEDFFKKAIVKYIFDNNIQNAIDKDLGVDFTYDSNTETITISKWENDTVQPPTNVILKAYTLADLSANDTLILNNNTLNSLSYFKQQLAENEFIAKALYKITEKLYRIENSLAVDALVDQLTIEAYLLQTFGLTV